jgi:hypothetical protein
LHWGQGGFGGLGYWPFPYAEPGTAAGGDASPVVIGAPALNIYLPPQSVSADPAEGGCVIHKLIYNRDGQFIGERQTPQC